MRCGRSWGVVTPHREEGHHQDLLSQRESRRRPAQHDPGHGRPAAGRLGPPRRPASVLDRGVLDRLAYDAIDPFAAQAAAVGVAERGGRATIIAIRPLRNTALLVRQAASVDALSAGRLTLGRAVGARLDDYETAGVDPGGGGARLSEQLAALRDGEELGARADLPLLVGGMA